VKPTVAVVIPAYCAEQTLPPLIAALQAQSHVPQEIIVVDDCSPDDTAQAAEQAGATVVRAEKNGGPGPARNLGVARATADVVMFTDADCLVETDWIERALSFMDAQDTPVTTSGYLGPVSHDLSSQFQHWEKRAREPFVPAHIAATNGHSLTVTRALFQKVGGMPDLRTSEDFLFGLRVSAEAKIMYDPANGVYHRFRPGVCGFFKQKMLFAQNSVIASRLHGWQGARPATFSPYKTLRELTLSVGALGFAWPAPLLALAALLARILPFWIFLARQDRARAPWLLFPYSVPQIIVRDVASLLGLLRGVGMSLLGLGAPA
jgi:hypothetical protein